MMEFKTEKTNRAEVFSEDGVNFLEVFIERIEILSDEKSAKKINAFYLQLTSSVYEYAKKTLLSESKAEYECSEDSRKRFSFRPYSYRLYFDVSEENEEHLSIICKLFFTRKGKILYEDRKGHIWNKRNGCLVPLRAIAGKEYKSIRKRLVEEENRRNSKIDRHSFALKNGRLVFFVKSAQNGRCSITEIVCPTPKENKEKVKENC